MGLFSRVEGADPQAVERVERALAGDDGERFVEALRQLHDPPTLAGLTDRWLLSERPALRDARFTYLDRGLDRLGHETVVKRLLRHAERAGDHDFLGALAVTLDTLIPRERLRRFYPGEGWRYLTTPFSRIPAVDHVKVRHGEVEFGRNPHSRTVKARRERQRFTERHGAVLFSLKTRHYLRRRVRRHFRALARRRPELYPGVVARLLSRYHSADLAGPAARLGAVFLIHACSARSPRLRFGKHHWHPVDAADTLDELPPAPACPELWRTESAADALLRLVRQARSDLLRLWALEMLLAEHRARLNELGIELILALAGSRSERIRERTAELLKELDTSGWSADAWRRLLTSSSLLILQSVTSALRACPGADALPKALWLELALRREEPVAALGLERLMVLEQQSEPLDRETLLALSGMRCPARAEAGAGFALDVLLSRPNFDADPDAARDAWLAFLDAIEPGVRLAALARLTDEAPITRDLRLWACLAESPFPRIRERVLAALEAPGSKLAEALESDAVLRLQATILLDISRGSRIKPVALRRMSAALVAEPARLPELAPVFRVALRSIREPERRAALVSLTRAAFQAPELSPALAREFPELDGLEALCS